MPELPEMETYREQLHERIAGLHVTAVDIGREKSINTPVETFRSVVSGSRVNRVDRRAKMLLFRLDNGYSLLLHLMLGGSMFFGTEAEKLSRTAQLVLSFGERKLYFHGLRLGYLHLLTEKELRERLWKLGPEPLDPGFGVEHFAASVGRGRGALKSVFTDQCVLSGIGNCYSDEICFGAGIRPLRRASELDPSELRDLFAAMRSVLSEAIRYGGYMESPFFVGDTRTGGYNDRCRVYDREGETCLRCGAAIVKTEHHGRKVFFCEHCQR